MFITNLFFASFDLVFVYYKTAGFTANLYHSDNNYHNDVLV